MFMALCQEEKTEAADHSATSVFRSGAPASVSLLRQKLKEHFSFLVLSGRCATAGYYRTLIVWHSYHLSHNVHSLPPDAVDVKAR